MKDIIAGRRANKWVISALVLASIVCASLSSTKNVSAQLCPERWEASLQGLKDTYKPGETIDFTINYLTRNPSDCSACRQQIIVGMINSSGKVIYVSCVYDGSPQTCPKETSGTGKISWKAPSDVGSYQILAVNDYQNSCEDAKANFRVKSSNRLLATIQVGTSSPAASSTKPTGSDTTGLIQNPFSTFQTWLQQMIKPSGTGTTTPATTPSTAPSSPTAGFSTWFQQNQKAIFSVIALIIIAVLGFRYLINRKRGERDKVITIILGAVALGYLLIIWIIIPIIEFIRIYWQPILISLLVVGAIAIVAWKKKWIRIGSAPPVSPPSPHTPDTTGNTPLDQFKKRLMNDGWREFEIYIEDLFQKMGFQAVATQPSKDGGIDVTASMVNELGTKINYIIQCKLYQDGNRVRERELRELWGIMQEKRSHGIIVCTGGFTKDAKEYADQRSIACWGIEDLFSHHQKYW